MAALGARDFQHAFDRALLQGQIECARWLHAHGRDAGAGHHHGLRARRSTSTASSSSPRRARRSPMSTATGSRRWRWCSRRTAGIPPGSTRSSNLRPARLRTAGHADDGVSSRRRRADSRSTCAAIRACSSAGSRCGEIYPPEMRLRRRRTRHALDADRRNDAAAPRDRFQRARDLRLAARARRGRRTRAPTVDADGFGGHTPLFNAVVCGPWGDARRSRAALLERGASRRTCAPACASSSIGASSRGGTRRGTSPPRSGAAGFPSAAGSTRRRCGCSARRAARAP